LQRYYWPFLWGIAATLLAPKVRLWWFLRNVKGTASQLVSLTEYRERLEKEPQFTLAETYIFELQFRVIIVCHFLAYLIVLAIAFIPKWHRHMTLKEDFVNTIPALPFVLLIWFSAAYLGAESFNRLRSSSPKEREKVARQIVTLVAELKNKMPPQN